MNEPTQWFYCAVRVLGAFWLGDRTSIQIFRYELTKSHTLHPKKVQFEHFLIGGTSSCTTNISTNYQC